MSNILILVDVQQGQAGDIALQGLVTARALAGADKVVAVAVGSGASGVAAQLIGLGADTVLTADSPELADYLPTPWLAPLLAAYESTSPALVVCAGNTIGNDLAPLLAAGKGIACVLDATSLRRDATGFTAARTEYDRKVATAYQPSQSAPLIVSVKDGIAAVPAPDAARTGTTQALAFAPATSKARIVKRDVATKTVNLKDARVIVGVGAGIGSKDNFAKVRDLARALGAELGATRAVVDAGWLPADHQIGQTGATVRPSLYVACGISGAVQHWVGMSEARTIIAINTDKGAPIMKRAHYRITADVNAVVPKLLKVLGS